MMVSFDVVSLFTSIPTDLAIGTIDELLQEKYDEVDQQLKQTHITELLELCLRTFFTFGDRVYEQKKGTPMGSPPSGLIAEAVLQRLDGRYVGETGKRLCTRLHEHQLAVNREDKLSLVYGHIQQEKHSFAFGKASVIGRASDKMARLVLESWSSLDTINRSFHLHRAYQALRTRLQSVRTGPTALANKSRLSQQLSPSQQEERASRGSDDRCETSTHRRAQTADRDSHMQRQLISQSDYGGGPTGTRT
ncbi:hypothetical protein SprV_0100233900 [Sparganum proliferum]